MKIFFAVVILLFSIPMSSQPEKKAAMQNSDETQATSMLADIHSVSPALERYTRDRLFGEVWKRPDLSPRDRSIVTLAILIARNQTVQMGYYIDLALDDGVKPSEIAEIITYLAFCSGWENAMSAVVRARDVFHQRGISPDQLPPATVELLPLNEASEKQRATSVEQNFGAVAPGVVQYTTDLLSMTACPDWPWDRSPVTVSALMHGPGRTSHLPPQPPWTTAHATRSPEMLTQLALRRWPNVFPRPVVKDVLRSAPARSNITEARP
jgi:4-carboxymuconolactone decarboxylase